MPNWVYNTVTVSSRDTRTIAKLKRELQVEENPFSFEAVIPQPPEEEVNWYNWRVDNWGTKWDSSDARIMHEAPDSITYYFETAWSLPTPLLIELSRQNPDLVVRNEYEEEQGWGGILEVVEGEVFTLDEYDIPYCHKDIADRGRECPCVSDDEQYYPDCYTFRAAKVLTDPAHLEAVKTLAADGWTGTFDELIETAKKL
jgi:hypothetical protein